MIHTVSVRDRDVAEIEAVINIFWVGAQKHEMAVACKEKVDALYPKVAEKNRLSFAMRSKEGITSILDELAPTFKMIERA